MTKSEEIYDSVAYYMKEDIGLPYNYCDLTIEQRAFVDAFFENYDYDVDNTIAELELTVTDLEREVAEAEHECWKLRKELENREGPFA